MELLIKSPLFIPYCLLMLSGWIEAYRNYRQIGVFESYFYTQAWYKLLIYLCDIVGIISLIILCISVSWWALAITIGSALIWLPFAAILITGIFGFYIPRPIAAIVSVLISIRLIILWF